MTWRPALLALLALGAPRGHAGISIADPDELRPVTRAGSLRVVGLSLRVRAVGWVGPSGSIPPRRLPAPLALHGDTALTAPPGAWSDVVLVLDGPVALSAEDAAGPLTVRLDLETLTVALDDPAPGGRYVLQAPEALPDDPVAAAAALRDGLLAVRVE